MTKDEILNALKASREINTFSNTPLWSAAFDLYNAQAGDKLRIKDNCSKCYNKVKEWLEK